MPQQPHFNINPQLLENAQKISGLDNQDEVINLALAHYLQIATQKRLLALEGVIKWEGDLEQLRTGRQFNDAY